MSDDPLKLVMPTQKTIRAIVLKVLSVIHAPLKVHHFKLFVNWSKIVGFMTYKRTRCRNYITHLRHILRTLSAFCIDLGQFSMYVI